MSVLVQVLLHFNLGRFGLGRNYGSLRLQMVIPTVKMVKWSAADAAADAALQVPGNSHRFSGPGLAGCAESSDSD